MKLIKRVNLLDDKKLIMKLNILTIPLFVIFFALFTLLTLDRKLSEEVTIDLMYLVIAILSMAGLIIVHELIHGIFLSCSIRKEKSNLVLRMVWPMQQVLIPFIQGGIFYLFCLLLLS